MKKSLAVFLMFVFLNGCASAERAMPDDFDFSVGTTTAGRVIEYHSEGNLLVKKNTTEGEEYTAELVLTPQEMQIAWDLFSMMRLDKYPDAPALYDPGTPDIQQDTDIRLWMRADGKEKMIFAEDVSMQGRASSADGIAFMNTVEILMKMIMGTEEYLSMPTWEE